MALRRRKVLTVCQKQHRSIRTWAFSIAALTMLLLLNTCDAQADEITVAEAITDNSVMPLAPGMADELAANLLTAQADSSYAASEPDSLMLSIAAVLNAIYLEGTIFDQTEIWSAQIDPIVWEQSMIAIDDRVTVVLTVNGQPIPPGGINFGDVMVPEPSERIMLLCGLDVLLLGFWLKRRKACKTTS